MANGIPNGTDLRQFYYLGSNKQPLNTPPATPPTISAATTAKPTSGSLYLSQAYTNKANQTGQSGPTTLSASLIPLVASSGVDTITATTTSVTTGTTNPKTPSPLTAAYGIKILGQDVNASLPAVSLQLNSGNDVVTGTALLSPSQLISGINKVTYFYLTGVQNEGSIYGGIFANNVQNLGSGNDSVTGVGTYRGIANLGTIDLGDGSDKLTGTAGQTNIVGSAGIYNASRELIALGPDSGSTSVSSADNDMLTATGTYTGLYNEGIIFTGVGNDTITTKAGTLFNQQTGLYNSSEAVISVGPGNDKIISSGYTAILNEGIIGLGTGLDTITATGTYFGLVNKALSDIFFDDNGSASGIARSITASGSISGLVNNGTIEFLGVGNDSITVTKGGISGDLDDEGRPLGSINFGPGNDKLTGFGTGFFDGGDGTDTLILPSNTAYAGKFETLVAPGSTISKNYFVLTGIQNVVGTGYFTDFTTYNSNTPVPTTSVGQTFMLTIAANGKPTVSSLPEDWVI